MAPLITAIDLVVHHREVCDRVSRARGNGCRGGDILRVEVQRIISRTAEWVDIAVAAVQRQIGFICRHQVNRHPGGRPRHGRINRQQAGVG